MKDALGTSPGNPDIYFSIFELKENHQSERLELLGDAVFTMAVLDYLFRKYPGKTEGDITQIKGRLVSRVQMNKIAEKCGLKYISEQFGIRNKGHDVYGNMLESLIGAIYLDKGFDKTIRIIHNKILKNYCSLDDIINTNDDYKSRLLRICQKNQWKVNFLSEIKGREIHIKLYVEDQLISEGKGTGKKKVEQLLAYHALQKIESNAP